MTAVETLVPSPATSHDDDITHIMCCADGDLALCGEDVAALPEMATRGAVCVPCGLAEQRADTCPKFGRCIEDCGILS